MHRIAPSFPPPLLRRTRPAGLALVLAVVLVLLLASPPSVRAATLVWPGPFPCDGGLQACVDGSSSGDVIEIVGNPVIDEDISIAASLTLRAAPGAKPEFAPDRSLTAQSALAADFDVTIEGLSFDGGSVLVLYEGTGAARLAVRRLRFERPATTGAIFGTLAVGSSSDAASLEVAVGECDMPGAGGIFVGAGSASSDATVAFNEIGVQDPQTRPAIMIRGPTTGHLDVAVLGNEVRGSYHPAAIYVEESSTVGTPTIGAAVVSNVLVAGPDALADAVDGIRLSVNDGEIWSEVSNNTVIGYWAALAFDYFETALGGVPSGTGTQVVQARNNVLAHGYIAGTSESGFTLDAQHNAFWDNVISPPTPGPDDVVSDPLLFSRRHPRPLPGSPLIDAGHGDAVLVLESAGVPVQDRDGLRRLKGAAVDIGAYETGDALFRAGPASGAASAHPFSHPSTDGNDTAEPLVGSAGPLADDHPIGVEYDGAAWEILNEDGATIPAGALFHVFAPAPGSQHFTHTTDGTNTTAYLTTIDHPFLNNAPDRIVHVTHRVKGDPPLVNPHPIGVAFTGFGGFGNWQIVNLDAAGIPLGTVFNVYVQEPSPGAFAHTTGVDNLDGDSTVLDHPLLDGTPCAVPLVTTTTEGTVNARTTRVEYSDSSSRWTIVNQDGTPMPSGVVFHVLVDPAQVFACAGPLFEDGFESGDSSQWSASVP